MSYKISPITADPSELRAVAVVSTNAMCQGDRGPSEYIKSGWPGIGTPAGVDLAEARFAKVQREVTDPNHFLKAVDPDTEKVIGIAWWAIRPEHPLELPNNPTTDQPDEIARAYGQAIRAERNDLIIAAHKQLRPGPVAEIFSNFVMGNQQRSGVGTQMVKHIITLCNAQAVPIVLIANPHAMGFYEHLGFSVVEDRQLKLQPPFHDRPQARIVSMVRHAG